MTHRRRKHIGRFARTAGYMARLAYLRAKSCGVPLAPLLSRAGLTRQQIHDRDAPLSVRDQVQFLELVAQALGDDKLGFHLALHCDLREVGLFYYVIASSKILRDALHRGARYSSTVNEGVAQQCIDGKELRVRIRYAGVSRHKDRQQIEFWVTALVRLVRHLTGVWLVPSHVHFVHRHKRGAPGLAQYFGCRVTFGAAFDEVAFAGKWRDLPLLNADPHLNRLLIAFSEKELSQRSKDLGSFQSKVENTIVPLLPHGGVRVGAVARRLGLSQRSLARHLAQEGLHFSKLLDDLRTELAKRYLTEEALSVSQISWLLGYQNVSGFSHAFRRWTGETPTSVAKRTRGRSPQHTS